MGRLTAYNSGSDIPGVYNHADLARNISGSGITSGSYELDWRHGVCDVDRFSYVTQTYTQSRAEGTVEDSTPIFYLSQTSSTDTLDVINRLPDRVAETPFTYNNTALNWVSGSGKYITLLDCEVYDFPMDLLQEDGSYLLQEDNSNIKLDV